MNNTNQSIPGMPNPTISGMIGSNPKESSSLSLMQMANKQVALTRAVGGRRKKRIGGASNYVVPQFTMYYRPTNGISQTPNDIIKQIGQNTLQQNINSQYDKYATMKGGNQNWNWGCYSGGKKQKKTKRINAKKNKIRRNKTRRNKTKRN